MVESQHDTGLVGTRGRALRAIGRLGVEHLERAARGREDGHLRQARCVGLRRRDPRAHDYGGRGIRLVAEGGIGILSNGGG